MTNKYFPDYTQTYVAERTWGGFTKYGYGNTAAEAITASEGLPEWPEADAVTLYVRTDKTKKDRYGTDYLYKTIAA